MQIGIVTNKNGRGLEKDAHLISPIIKSFGHEVALIQYDVPCMETFKLLIFLEVTPRNLIGLSEAPPWVIVNPEFLKSDNIKLIDRHFGKILCKTHEAHRICSELFGERAFHTGFISEDKYDETIKKQPKCLHIAGQSRVKGTMAVIDAWRWKQNGRALDGELTVVADWLNADNLPQNVTVLNQIPDAELKRLQNECLFHLQPSSTEGWSHVIHESLSVNATILTVAFPPMDEFKSAIKIKPSSDGTFNAARTCEVSALDVHNTVKYLLETGSQTCTPRKEFLAGNEAFKTAFSEHLAYLTEKPSPPVEKRATPRKRGSGLQVSFIGNFKASESTENMIKWALEEGLGHDVDMLQENEVNFSAIHSSVKYSDMLVWVRTPGWLNVPDREMIEFLERLRVPSISVHLDKFWGIPEREALIGVHPFWKTKFVFTADGSRQREFNERKVNHHWMKPAVSEVYCHPGQPWDMYRCDVGFVGAKDYHSEYPFRRHLVEFLETTYRDRFKHITGLRGHGLNDFYASCKVVVGDCIFAGTPNYWSDRVPETCGRHGFLLHPSVGGLATPLAAYFPQNLESLKECIERWLSYDQDRKYVQRECAAYTLRHDTWTVRMREILEVVIGTKAMHG